MGEVSAYRAAPKVVLVAGGESAGPTVMMKDDQFRQRVRRHRPSSLVPLLAKQAAKYWSQELAMGSPYRKYQPWILLEVARVSLVYGNEHRSPATEADLLACCDAFDALRDPELSAHADERAFANFFLRVQHQQLPHQQLIGPDIARSAALFTQTKSAKPLKTLAPGWIEELLGANLSAYVGVAFLLFTSALVNGGQFGPGWLSQPNFAEIVQEIPADEILSLLEQQFSTDIPQLRSMQAAQPNMTNQEFRRFGFNPLTARPVVSGLVPDRHVVPVPWALLRKASPLGIFYAGIAKWGNAFSDDVGPLFESYIGRQLRLLPAATVLPSIVYGKERAESVDWIVVFDNLILLVEVKSTRPSEQVRLGGQSAGDALTAALHRAVEQVDRTAALIRARHPAFAGIPKDRPLAALMVTMEPFFAADAPAVDKWVPRPSVPARFCSAHELEGLVVLRDDVPRLLVDHMTSENTRGWSIRSLLTGRELGSNPILDEGSASYPWTMPVPDPAGRERQE